MKPSFAAIVAFICLLPLAYGTQAGVPFNLGEVMEEVTHHPRIEGEQTTIGGQVYQASFEGSRVIPTSSDGEHSYRFPIEEGTKPHIWGGIVCCETPDGEIQFRDPRLGLRYQRVINHPGFQKHLDNMVIRMNGQGNLSIPEGFTLSDALGRKVAHGVDNGGLWISQKDVPSSQFPLTLNGEFLIDTNVVYVPEAGSQELPSVAFDGTNYLVVWVHFSSISWYDIYGARVDQSGVVLDPAGIPISTAGYYQGSPSVAFDGTNYLVVWEDYRSGSSWDIYGARVNQSGVVLDPAGIPISNTANDQFLPSVAFDGTNYLVVWEDYRSGSFSDIYGARMDQAGIVLDPAGVPISTATDVQWSPSVAFDGTNYLVVWEDYRSGSSLDIYGARMDQAGIVLDPTGISISTAADVQWFPSVAFDGTIYLVVWGDYRSGSSYDIYGARVDQAGVVLDPAGIPISTAADNQDFPSVAFDDTYYLVVWGDYRSGSSLDIYGARVDQSGVVLDPAGISIATAAGSQDFPSVAFDGTNYLVVWGDGRSDPFYDIYGTRVDQAGVVFDPVGIPISTAANRQESPSVGSDGTNYLVIWGDYRSGPFSDIYAARVDQSGVVLDPVGIPISTAANRQESPSVAFGGANYLVVWQDDRSGPFTDIYGARVDQAGVVLDPVGTPISTAASWQEYPSTVFGGINYLVVWQDYRNGSSSDIYGARVDQSGVVLDPAGIPVSTAADDQWFPSVAFDGTNYLVVWQDYRDGSSCDIYGARVNQAGNVLNPAGIPISTAPDYQWRPTVAFNGTNYLVVWEDYRSGSSYDIYGARVDQAGFVLDPTGIPVSIFADDQGNTSIVFDGTNYLVVWQNYRIGYYSCIYGAKLNTSVVVIDSFAVSLQSGSQISPALAHGTGNQSLITYSGWADSINAHPANTMRIWGRFHPFIGVEEGPTEGPLPRRFVLEQNYPNPFNASTTIRYHLPAVSHQRSAVSLKIYNILGRQVKTLVDEKQPAGNFRVLWDGRDNSGRDVSSGVYFCRLEVIGDRLKVGKTSKMVILR